MKDKYMIESDESELLHSNLINIANHQVALGLFSGKMGHCIYFYEFSRLTGNDKYAKVADDLLDSVCHCLKNYRVWDIESGLIGIGLGINYLVKHNFICGSINKILREFDILLFKVLLFPEKHKSVELNLKVQLLFYYSIRIKDQKKGSNAEFIFKELIFKILNSFTNFSDNYFDEPYSFSVDYKLPFFLLTLGTLAKEALFRVKIKKLIDDMPLKISSQIPLLHSHRVYLILGMLSLAKEFDLITWQKHIQLIQREIDVNVIFSQEFYDRNIFFKDGITGIAYILSEYNKRVDNKNRIDFSYDDIKNKIRTSETWDQLMTDSVFFRDNCGLSGFCGISLLNFLNS